MSSTVVRLRVGCLRATTRPNRVWLVGSAFGDRAFYHGDWLLRAAAALAGIYGNVAVEAMYPLTVKDIEGQKLDGSKYSYALTFPLGQLPPPSTSYVITLRTVRVNSRPSET